MNESVLMSCEDSIVTLSLNNPAKLNAVNAAMWRRLRTVMEELSVDDSLRCVVLRGAGERGFSAGGDMVAASLAAQAGDPAAARFFTEEYALNARIARCPKPVVAVMDGIVLGGGVAANRGLRRSFQQACEKYGLKLVVPAPKRCTDNGAMIGYAGALELARGTRHDFDLGVSTHTQLLRSTRRGGGKRPNRPR